MDSISSLAFGSSLPVPSVRDIAASLNGCTGNIPERFVRPEANADSVADFDLEIPVIDLSRTNICQQECSKMGDACQEWGIFQVINHGVPTELIEKIKADVAEFFELPLEEKEALAFLPNSAEGYGQHFIKSEEQKLDWADMMILVTQPHSSRNMRFWPSQPLTFRDTLDAYTTAVREVARCLLRMMVENLGLDPEMMMSNKFKTMQQLVKMNHYPPCPEARNVVGLSPHSDTGVLTVLLQATADVQGLQIRKNGKWFPIKPLPGALIVNVGDTLEILSNGKYKSTEHRAVINPEKERLSIATFHSVLPDCIVGPLPEIVKGGFEKYKTMTYKDYMKAYFSTKHGGKGQLERVKLAN